MLHALAIAAVISAGPGWLGLVLALRRGDGQASTEQDAARTDDMRLAA